MNYYVRKSGDSKVEGPFTIEKIRQLLAEGFLASDSLATADLGEGMARISKSPKRDWCELSQIAELGGRSEACESQKVGHLDDNWFSHFVLFAALHFGASILLGFMVFAWAWGSGLSDSYRPESSINIFSLALVILQAPVALVLWIFNAVGGNQSWLGINGLIALGAFWSLLAGFFFSQLLRK